VRQRSENTHISVHAIAGTEVVLLGLNATEEAVKGLLGFTIYKREEGSERSITLSSRRTFEEVPDTGEAALREPIDSETAPIQAFMWGDYVVDPKTTYTYRVMPVYGTPGTLEPGEGVEVTITTEDPEEKTHAVYFNRGVAGSREYSERFGRHRKWYKVERRGRTEVREFVKPEDVPERKAYEWLSRGLEEAMLAFIAQADGPEYAIRAAVYEFTYLPVIQAFVDALERGVDVKIIHHAKRENVLRLKRNPKTEVTMTYKDGTLEPVLYKSRGVTQERPKDSVGEAADAALQGIGLTNPDYLDEFDQMMIERTITQISHNKFIVLLKNDEPVQVWTGSTNFTAGGTFGQSNVGHVVRDTEVARKYHDYWQKLSTDPRRSSASNDPHTEGMRNWTVRQQPDLQGPPPANSITPVFSPRLTKAMLDWYAGRLAAADSSVFFTAAFSVADEIFEKLTKAKDVDTGHPYLRYLLLESITGTMRKKYYEMEECPQNRIAWGDILRRRDDEDEHKQFIETLAGLNDHVEYLHTKYMLIDPLSDDPTVISGSANFSKNSTVNNDENMLIVRGNTRLADIFLGEFMRLCTHFHVRNKLNAMSEEEADRASYLCPDDSWTIPYYSEGTQEQSERLLFY
jgi:phosphatidylserine/phosphatidylglycerophosphate/cardiolipin synthase-like enzyme